MVHGFLSRFAVVLAATSLLTLGGCATARNYDDPSGPVIAVQPIVRGPRTDATAGLRVITFNIKFAQHVDRAAHLLMHDAELRNADVLAVQEMDESGTALLAAQLGMNHVYVPSAVHPASHRDFGVAILSPWPITDGRKVPLPYQHRFRKLKRAVAVATVHAPLGAVRVYSVHLESAFGLSENNRRAQARAVLADTSSWEGPIVIAGDFNGRGPAEEIARGGFTWLTRDVHHTASLFDLDHVLARGLCAAGHLSADKVRSSAGASDHRPVWSTLQTCA